MKCGDIYRRVTWYGKDGKNIVCRCCTRVEHGPKNYDAPSVCEEELQGAVVRAMNEVLKMSEKISKLLIKNIEEVVDCSNINEIEGINKEISLKQKELLTQVRAKRTIQTWLMK